MAAELPFSRQRKRLILCCDGTWKDSDDGYTKPTLFPYNPTAVLQVPSNITRISHALKRHGHDGTPQIIYYHSGVGTGTGFIENFTGGLLGTGISENIRETYSFIANNYTPGDEIILIGFSRGAFTVRSVAGMIRDIGLLTLQGMDTFYPIFKDQENFRNKDYRDVFPDLPFPDKPRDDAGYDQRRYKKKLVDRGLARVYDPDGRKIQVQAVAVFDTVGSLGIPNTAFLSKLGLPHSTKEFKFYDTNLSKDIRHAFQALALDEHRRPFAPAVWERRDNVLTDLRQVWFPGAHSNIGGGYDDQEIANVTLAWMMDQLASIGVAFKDSYINKIFDQNVQYYENAPRKSGAVLPLNRHQRQWAVTPVYEKHRPVRPWGLGEIYKSETGIWHLAGKQVRTPGRYMRSNPDTGLPSRHRLVNTNERIHSSVRIRLDLDGLDLDDKGLYQCSALLKNGLWELRKVRIRVQDAIPSTASWGRNAPPAADRDDDLRWIWEYVGPEETAPKVRILIEENLGPYERQLLSLNKGRSEYKKHRRRRRRKKGSKETTIVDDARGTYVGQGREFPEPLYSGNEKRRESYHSERRRRSSVRSGVTNRDREKGRVRVETAGWEIPIRGKRNELMEVREVPPQPVPAQPRSESRGRIIVEQEESISSFESDAIVVVDEEPDSEIGYGPRYRVARPRTEAAEGVRFEFEARESRGRDISRSASRYRRPAPGPEDGYTSRG